MGKRTLRMLLIIVALTGILSVVISATDNLTEDDGMLPPGQAIITIPGVNDETGASINLEVIAVEGSEIRYLLTNDNGRATYKDATPENYNIMFEYPIDGVPTITLKGAKLINGMGHAFAIGRLSGNNQAGITNFPCQINVMADSEIYGTYNVPGQPGTYGGIVSNNKNTLTISGPGKLSLKSDGMYPLLMDGDDLTIKEANIYAYSNIAPAAGVRPAIWVKDGDIIIDKSVVEVFANNGPCIWISDSVSGISEKWGERYDITIQNNSNIKVNNPNSNLAAIGCKNNIYIMDSQVEVFAKTKCFTPEPVLTNVGAIVGSDRLSAETYDPEKSELYHYFLTVLEVVEPTEETTATEESTEATGDSATEATEQTGTESTDATQEATDGSMPPVTETITPTAPSETIAPATEPADPEPTAPNTNCSWIVFVLIGFMAVAAGAIYWFVIRRRMRK